MRIRMIRTLTTTLVALCALVAIPSPRVVRASESAQAGSSGGSIWAGVQSGTPTTAGTWGGIPCSWSLESAYDSSSGSGSSDAITMVIGGIEYVFYTRTCGSLWGSVWVPRISISQLAKQAALMVRAQLPAPNLRMAPAPGSAVVRVGTWFWVDSSWWHPISATAWIPTPDGVLWSTATAVPTTITFATEDSTANTGITEEASCVGPGLDWNVGWGDQLHSSCSYTYRHASTTQAGGVFSARASVDWSISWTASTGEGGDLPDWRSTAPLSIRVQELHALVR